LNIAFIGGMCTGKTTHADMLVKRNGFVKISLAGPIRELEAKLDETGPGAAALADLVNPYLQRVRGYGTRETTIAIRVLREALDIPRESPKPRKRLQYIGTNGFRNQIDMNVWVKMMIEKMGRPEYMYTNWVCDDIRFANEYEGLHDKFLMFKLVLPLEDQLARIAKLYPDMDLSVLEHPSETEIASITVDDEQTIDTTASAEAVHFNILRRIPR